MASPQPHRRGSSEHQHCLGRSRESWETEAGEAPGGVG